uniref:C2H2-type domain-containing protein n=1 Tax=Astyanax mexicanus TaxID=7994 RepID=A0A3B1K879_ASTMX
MIFLKPIQNCVYNVEQSGKVHINRVHSYVSTLTLTSLICINVCFYLFVFVENVSQEDSEVEPIPEKNPLKEEYIADKYHQGINPYERFDHSDASQQTVKDHLKIHTGESPVSCFKAKPEEDLVQEECHVTNSQHISQHGKKCSYPFQQTPKDHVEIHTGDNSPLQFGLNHIQEQCGAEKSNLSVHHKRFCRDASQQIMNDHLKIHTGENPFTSFEPTLEDNHYQEQHNAENIFQSIQHGKDCSDAFQETATDHLKIHTGESPVSYFQPKLEDHHFQEEHNGDEFYQSIQPEPHSTQQTVGNHLIHSPIHTGDSSVSCLDPKTEVNLFQEACSVDKSQQNIQHERMCSDATKQTVEDHLSIHTGYNPISCLELTMEENHLQEKCSADKFCKSIQHEEIHSDAPQQTMEDHLKIHAGENSVFGLEPKNEENLFQEKCSVGRSQHNILYERMCSDATKETVEDHLKIHTGDNPMACLELKMEENHIQEKCSAEKFRQSIEHDEINSDAPQQTMEDDLKIHAGDNLVFCLEPKKEENLFQENCGVDKSQQNIQHERMCSETIQQTVEDHLKIHTGDNHLTCKEPKKEENLFQEKCSAEKFRQSIEHDEINSDAPQQTMEDHLKIHTGDNPMACLELTMEENHLQEKCSAEKFRQSIEHDEINSDAPQQTMEDHLKIHTGDNPMACLELTMEENHLQEKCSAEKFRQSIEHDEINSDATQQTVKDHLKIHTRDNPVACLEPKVEETLCQEECSVENCQQNIQRESLCSSNTQQTVEDHLKIHTGDNDPFTCSTCGKNFSSARSLQWHMDVHSGKRPHQCSQCGKSFKRLSNLREHGKIHTGERPFPCSQCGKTFLKLSNLKDHVLIHTRERPFGCTYCGNSFSTASVFGKHRCKYMEKRRHQCSQCEKSYVRRSQLKMHQGIHHRTPTDTEKEVWAEAMSGV